MQVNLTKEAESQFNDLPVRIQERVIAIVERLEMWPQVSGVKKLTGQWSGFSRLRTGDYRIIFKVKSSITIVKIAHRRNVY